jgi:ring-1,2-phenylacetyl-CoA epoxidase subunit PaaA
MMKLCKGSPAQKRMAQDALDRWWWPSLMMFGPPDSDSIHSAQSAQWRIKLNSNDELRQKMVDQTVPQAEYLGLTIPDSDLKWNDKTGHYDFGPIDWNEFYNVLKGHGPCNQDRLRVRTEAYEQGAWFRDALAAHAEKTAARQNPQGTSARRQVGEENSNEQGMAFVGGVHPKSAWPESQARR